MADFKTHLIGAAAVSGVAATALMLAGAAGQRDVVNYFILGTVGGLLPDIDSDTSIPLRIAFNLLAVTAGFVAVFAYGGRYSLVELVILWTACFAAVRYGVFLVFTRYTVHRGLIHSLPAGAVAGLLTVWLAYHLFDAPAARAWFCGLFVTLGFMVHLLLDELYSVDLMGVRWKRSFGTAFNLGSLGNPLGTAALYMAIAALIYLLPPAGAAFANLLDDAAYRQLLDRLLPRNGWFDGLFAALTAGFPRG